jgi:hypothetical protein
MTTDLEPVERQLPAYIARQAAAHMDHIQALAVVTEHVIDETGQITRFAAFTTRSTLIQSRLMRAAAGCSLSAEEEAALELLDTQCLETITKLTDMANAKLLAVLDNLPPKLGVRRWWE